MGLPQPLIEHLSNQRATITKRWLSTLWNSPDFITPEKLSAPRLLDHLPNLLDDLADYLGGNGAPHAEHHARVHGRYRWEQHFRLDEVLRELLVIRDIIAAEVEHYGIEHQPLEAGVSREVQRRIARFFDEVLLYSASQFSEQQQRQIEEDKRLVAVQHQAASTEMQAIDGARLRLLRTIAHELRNMLNVASLTMENLHVEKDPKWRTELEKMLYRSHEQMMALVNQLLEMAPLLARREALRLAPLNVAAFAADQSRLFGRMAAVKHLSFNCPAPPAGLTEVVTDELKLQRIVTNLVQNALKYTPRGGSVEIRFEPVDAKRWCFSVTDTGRGIPEEHRGKIFDEFHRVPGSETQEGAGLGLSIVRQLVALFQGEISLESEVGRGSTFCVTLPRDPREVT